jgi:dolichyl-phosphate-mannose-protein mannosyltransferase
MAQPRPGRPWLTPLLVAVIGLGLFVSTWTDAVQAADSGEVITAACNLGVAHPPGYPLHTLLGHGICALPWSTPAGRVGALSVLAGVWALLMVYATVMLLTRNRWAAAVAALTLAAGSIFWRQSSLAGVSVLNAALAATVVYTAIRAAAHQHLGWSALAGLCSGLALSHHHSSAVVLPLVLLAVARPRPSWRAAALRTLLCALGLAVGLLPYLQLVLADPQVTPRWGDPSTLGGLIHHVLRRDYGTLSFTISGGGTPLSNLWHYISRVPSQTAWLLWPLALLGMATLAAHAQKGRPLARALEPGELRRDLGPLLALLPVLAGPGFMLLFNIDPVGIGGQVMRRFFILPNTLLAICLGVGLAAVDLAWLQRRVVGRAGLWRGAAWVVVGLAALLSYSRADVSKAYTVEDYARNALSVAERGALILGAGDVRTFSTLYAQQMLRARPDVHYVDVHMLLYPWYVDAQRRRRPEFSYRYQKGNVNTIGLIHAEMRRGVPVYLATDYNQKVMSAYGGYPVGPLFRLVPPGHPTPSPAEVQRVNRRVFRGLLRRGRPPDPDTDPWAANLLEAYARTWRSVARALYSTGDRRGALKALYKAQRWAPWLAVPEWFGQTRGQPRGPTSSQTQLRRRP